MLPTKKYNNFVKASSYVPTTEPRCQKPMISGEQIKRIYLETVKEVKTPLPSTEGHTLNIDTRKHNLKRRKDNVQLSNKDLFVAVQENDVETVKLVLDECPEKLNVVDEFGWSLLMIACQANSAEIVKELLHRHIDTSVRDKAGNSAQSLVIKNKNFLIATMLLECKPKEEIKIVQKPNHKNKRKEYKCETCNDIFPDKEQHLSSTVHNINASKDKKIPTCYRIPETNRGFQIMLKTGWDKDTGLGSDGSGIKYPIKPFQKKDRKGLGHEKTKQIDNEENMSLKHTNKKLLQREHQKNKNIEINFRREFY